MMLNHDYQDLINLFNHCFAMSYNTRLVKGDEEPVYLPANAERPYHAIYFAHGFFSSALHEISHWLIAGEARRQQVDFGYWYAPDGRNAEQQALFQQVEVKPQALEWILAKACGYPFRVSFDNLNGDPGDGLAFKTAIFEQVQSYCQKGVSARTAQFREALCDFYRSPKEIRASDFQWEELR